MLKKDVRNQLADVWLLVTKQTCLVLKNVSGLSYITGQFPCRSLSGTCRPDQLLKRSSLKSCQGNPYLGSKLCSEN